MRLSLKLAVGAWTLVAASACRTGGSGSATKSDDSQPTPDASASPDTPTADDAGETSFTVVNLAGDPAKSVYDATHLEEKSTATGTMKTFTGRLTVWCTHNGIPPGAQGIMGPTNFKCSATVPLPPGAQGFPAPAFMHVEQDVAVRFYDAFRATEKFQNGIYTKTFSTQNATYKCQVTDSTNQCTVVNGSGSGGPPPGALGMPAPHSGSGAPPGALGMPAPQDGNGPPPGALGMPAPQDGT